jgi:hypothetical protein
MTDETEPIDVSLHALRKRIGQVRSASPAWADDWRTKLVRELADEAEKMADYVGQPDMEKVALHHALHPGSLSATAVAEAEHQRLHMGYAPAGPPTRLLEVGEGPRCVSASHPVLIRSASGRLYCRDCGQSVPEHDAADAVVLPEDDEPVPGEFCMSDVVDEIARIAPDVVAYVEQTGGGCATIYAGKRRESATGDADSFSADAVLFQHPHEDFGRWPIMAGPGSFDWHGRDHTAHVDDFYVGPDTELMAPVPGPPYGPYPGEYTATREDTPATLAMRIVAAVRSFGTDAEGVAEGVIVWPGR